jgi:hypothetical protein
MHLWSWKVPSWPPKSWRPRMVSLKPRPKAWEPAEPVVQVLESQGEGTWNFDIQGQEKLHVPAPGEHEFTSWMVNCYTEDGSSLLTLPTHRPLASGNTSQTHPETAFPSIQLSQHLKLTITYRISICTSSPSLGSQEWHKFGPVVLAHAVGCMTGTEPIS